MPDIWPALVAYCATVCLSPLKDPLEALLTHDETGVLHADQSFKHSVRPVPDEALSVTVRPAGTREMRGSYILRLTEELRRAQGELVIEGSTTLVVASREALSAGQKTSNLGAGGSREKSESDILVSSTARAGPAELVRYAGASGDFNPIHWDTEYARSFGFEGPIVHGMLMYHWVIWTLAGAIGSPEVLEARIRFSSPMLAGSRASIRVFEDFSFEIVEEGVTEDARSQGVLVAKGTLKQQTAG